MKNPVIRWIVLLILLLCARLLIAGTPATTPLLASHRELPTAWQCYEITSNLTAGPDGKVYFVAAGNDTNRFIRFNPVSQQFEHLADLSGLWADRRSCQVTTPVVFDGQGNAWLGTMAMSENAGGPAGCLLMFSATGMDIRESNELPERSIIGLGYDRERARLLVLAAGTDTRLMSFTPETHAWEDLGVISAQSPQAPLIVVLPDGGAVIIDGQNSVYRFDAKTDTLTKTAAVLPAGADGVLALTAAAGGTVYGITRKTEVLFACDAHNGVRSLGRTFPDRSHAWRKADEEPTVHMTLVASLDGNIYYGGYNPNDGLVGMYDPRTGAQTVQALSSPAGAMAPTTMYGASAFPDGRVYLAGCGTSGCGLFTFPPLPETAPWSTTERSYSCRQVKDSEIVLDGRPDEPAWRRIPPLTNLVNTGSGTPVRFPTTAYIAWSDTHLYVAYRCVGECIKCKGTERDGNVWEGECAEVFLAPHGGDAPYYEIELNPNGMLYDSRVMSYSWLLQGEYYLTWAHTWNPEIKFKTIIEHDAGGQIAGWTMEMAIPFDALGGTPKIGESWLFNAYRMAFPANGQEECQAWHPTYADFHKPHQYPKLKFVK